MLKRGITSLDVASVMTLAVSRAGGLRRLRSRPARSKHVRRC